MKPFLLSELQQDHRGQHAASQLLQHHNLLKSPVKTNFNLPVFNGCAK